MEWATRAGEGTGRGMGLVTLLLSLLLLSLLLLFALMVLSLLTNGNPSLITRNPRRANSNQFRSHVVFVLCHFAARGLGAFGLVHFVHQQPMQSYPCVGYIEMQLPASFAFLLCCAIRPQVISNLSGDVNLASGGGHPDITSNVAPAHWNAMAV